MLETGIAEKRMTLEYLGDGKVQNKEIEWICLREKGEDELLLNGYIPCNFSYFTHHALERAEERLQVYECVNPLKNPFIDFQYVVRMGETLVMVQDLLSLLHYAQESPAIIKHIHIESRIGNVLR